MPLPTPRWRSAIAALLLLAAGAAHAQYPDKPVTWVVPFPPGGPTDVASRVLAQAFEKALGKPFVALNKAGASGSIGMRQVITSAPDGHTVGMLVGPSLLAPLMQDKPAYDLTQDVQAVGMAYVTPLVLAVNPKVLPDVTDLPSLVAAARARELNVTSPATGSIGHLSFELLKQELDFPALHIGYQGSAPAVTATLAGDVSVIFADGLALLPHIQAGTLRAIAVNAEDFAALPDVPSLASQGVRGTRTDSWGGLVVPVGTPQPVVERLQATLQAVLQDPAVVARLRASGAEPRYGDSAAMTGRIAEDTVTWTQVIETNDLRQHR